MQWRESGWNSGGRRVDPEGLLGVGCEEGAMPQKKIDFFHMKLRVLVHSKRYFLSCLCPCQKNVEFSA